METSFRFVLTTRRSGRKDILGKKEFTNYFLHRLSYAFSQGDPVEGIKELKKDIAENNSCEQIKTACGELHGMHPRIFPIFLDALKMRKDCTPRDMCEAFESILADTEIENGSFVFHTNFGLCLFLDIKLMMEKLLAPYDIDLMGEKTKEIFGELFA